jgi:predicted AAA+ superfamily ATPase
MLDKISLDEVRNRLYFDNPWWEEGYSGNKRISNYPKRSYFDSFYKLIKDSSVNRALILMGLRRVGKTVLVHHAIADLLEQGISGNNILYLSIETPIYTGLSLEKSLGILLKEFRHKRDDKNIYIFYDEIQYLKDWEIHLKSLVDSYPNYKFIVTGSAAAALKLKSKESGAGRFTDFILPPLTFSEFLRFIKKEYLIIKPETTNGAYRTNNIQELNTEFINYLNYGGYPEAVFSDTIQQDSARYIKSDIIDKVLLRDLPSLYGVGDIQELNRLFAVLAYNTSREVSYDDLAQDSGIAKNTLRKYLDYLEAAFLIKKVYRIDKNSKRFKRIVSFKVYLTNPSMRAALFGNVHSQSEFIGELTETAIYSQWLHSGGIENIFYARWKGGEVDMVYNGDNNIPNWFVEIKWSNKAYYDNKLLKNCVYFYNLNKEKIKSFDGVTITTSTEQGIKEYNGITFEFTPSSLYAYTVSKNLFKYK